MNVFMLRTFWIRCANIRIDLCKTHFTSTLQLDHRYRSSDMHLQLREVGNGASPRPDAVIEQGRILLVNAQPEPY
jgi:hypothetical protein